MTVLAWSPLRNGLLTGKYLPENVKQSEADGARHALRDDEGLRRRRGIHPRHRARDRRRGERTRRLRRAGRAGLAELPPRAGSSPSSAPRKLSQFEDNLRSLDVTALHRSSSPLLGQGQRRHPGLPTRLHVPRTRPQHRLRRPPRPDQSLIGRPASSPTKSRHAPAPRKSSSPSSPALRGASAAPSRCRLAEDGAAVLVHYASGRDRAERASFARSGPPAARLRRSTPISATRDGPAALIAQLDRGLSAAVSPVASTSS